MGDEGGFEAILARVEADLGAGSATEPYMEAAIRGFREAVRGADNLGGTHDDRDVYVLLDRLVAAVRSAYPGVKCGAGCSGCCDSETAIFDVSREEWGRLIAHVRAAWSPERIAAFGARFQADHGQRLPAYRALGWIKHFEPVADRYWAKHPYRCPFLEDGRCSVYAARPLACRMYGYFAMRARLWSKPAIYGCRMQADYFGDVRAQGPLRLPSVNAVAARVGRLTRRAGWSLGDRPRILPLWIAAEWPEPV